ncbi:DUF305 domain-containing protein [Actinomycetes bacterium KLBMP 9797]
MTRVLMVAVLALWLGGCTATAASDKAEETARPAAAAAHNAADVAFLQAMVAHHQQGIAVADVAADRAVRAEVRLLAAAAAATQRDEVTIMEYWLRGWQESTVVDHASHADHGGRPAIGAAELDALRGAAGSDVDTTFLTLFTGHQHQTVELTRLVTTGGANPETRDLARRAQESATAQAAEMLSLLSPVE